MESRILFVDDDSSIRFGVRRHLERSGFVVAEAASCEAAKSAFTSFTPQAVLIDLRLPDGDGLELVAAFRRERPEVTILVLTGYATIDVAVRAMKMGADDMLIKPVDLERLAAALRRNRPAERTGEASHVRVKSDSGPLKSLFALRDDLERLKNIDCSLLILGETGTGKSMLSRWLHEHSRRRDRPFVDLNCAGLARDLVESELFGHERGAFTSAHTAKPGMFELADGGTLFLDEIGDIDVAVQAKLLKVIEEKRFRRVGASRERSVDVRVISATHRDLRDAARADRFRADLYYRLSTVTVTLPALRERRAEIPAIARELLVSLALRAGRGIPRLTADAEALLTQHSWPGNVRELKNVLERALHFTERGDLGPGDLRIEECAEPASFPSSSTLRAAERSQIERALASHPQVTEAARSLGISRSSMYAKMKTYGLSPTRASASVAKLRVGGGS